VAHDREHALGLAGRALARRDRSAAELEAQLERRGIDAEEREAAVGRLTELGYIDDERFARNRAEALAERGYGDAAIVHDLEQRGIGADVVEQALAELAPETARAARIAAVSGSTAKTARALAAKGFSEDAIEAAVGVGLD
jgi:regulatory protein